MKKLILAGLMAVAGYGSIYAQTEFRPCGTVEAVEEAKLQDPGYAQRLANLENFTRHYVQSNQGNQKTSGTVLYVIPVVFHVIHNYGPENISKAQIEDAVEILNKSFQNLFADTVLVATLFKPIIADVQVEFRLAQIDPNGNCTDGITRTVSTQTYSADNGVKALIDWPSNKYMNVWVVANIASGAAGYAQYPGAPANIDGIVIRHDYTGGIGTSSGSNYASRSLTHEVGHWLNLPHTWGSTNSPGLAQNCSDDDFVADTPNTIGTNNFSCDTNQVTCNSIDNVQNYMDYASCHYMFTEGQKLRMHAALTNTSSSSGDRFNLYTQANLIATGTNDGFVPPPCVPTVDFNRNTKYICSGETITFTDLSWGGNATSWQWDIPGGTPSVSVDQNPVIQYNTPGIYDVTLTVSNSAGSNSLTVTGKVVVSAAVGTQAVPFVEDFENTGPIPSGSSWIIENPAGNNAWELTTNASFSGSTSMLLTNFSGNSNNILDAFVTPGYDFTNIVGGSVTFRLAFAARSSQSTDQLKVYASSTCGELWAVRYTKSGLNLSTAGIITSNFVPNASQWRQESLSVSGVSYDHKPSVRLKFEYLQNTGNNIYIDDINVTGTSTVGIQDVELLATLNIYPNPSQDATNISFSTSVKSNIRVEVTDIAGRVVETLENKELPSGNYMYSFGQNYPAGIYFVRVHSNENDLTRKVILTR